jgi:hypothetical protein
MLKQIQPVAGAYKSPQIAHSDDDGQHQYILKPVSGEGRVRTFLSPHESNADWQEFGRLS